MALLSIAEINLDFATPWEANAMRLLTDRAQDQESVLRPESG